MPRPQQSAWCAYIAFVTCLPSWIACQGTPATLTIYSTPGSTSQPSGGGSCGYGELSSNSWPFGNLGSISASNSLAASLPSSGCGACVQIKSASGSAATNVQPTILIVDNGLSSGLSVPSSVFADIANPSQGSANVILSQVDCQPPNNIVIRLISFRPDQGGYLKLVLLNVAGTGAVQSIGLRKYQTQDAFEEMKNTYGAVWEADTLPGLPLDVRITESAGNAVTIPGAITASSSGDIPTIVQFPGGASSSSAPAAAPAASSPASPSPSAAAPAVEVVNSPSPSTAAAPAATPVPSPVASPPPSPRASPSPPPKAKAPAPAPARQPPSPAPVAAAPTPTPASPTIASPGSVSASAPVSTALPGGSAAPAPSVATVPLHTGPGGCSTVLAVLQNTPNLSDWTQLLEANGDASALDNTALKLTMFAPTDQAFSTPIANGKSAAQLLAAQPSVQAPLIGYHIVGGYIPSSELTPGKTLTTTDYVEGNNGQQQQLTISVGQNGTITGAGSTAQVQGQEIEACGGPSVVHIISNVLLPFNASST